MGVKEGTKALAAGAKKQADAIAATSDIMKEYQESMDSINAVAEKLDASLSATAAGFAALKASSVIVGDTATRFLNLNEALQRSTTGVEELALNKKKLRDQLFELNEEQAKFGVSLKDNYEAAKTLTTSNVKLLDIYKKNAVSLVDFSGRLQAFRVDAKDSSDMIGTLTSNLDMNAAQLDTTRRSLVGFARQTGQSVKEVVESYTKSIKGFMDFLDPKEMNKAFMQFQVMARRMGMEANDLYGIATKFDTIEQSQEIGGKMNQVFSSLGIEFNALALQEMEPKQRVEYLSKKTREALERARGMGGMEGRLITKALVSAGGFADPAQLRAFAAEGGGRRATTPFERGGGRVTEVSRREEALLARRENFTKVAAANAKRRSELFTRQLSAFGKFEKLIERFPSIILTTDEKIDRAKVVATKAIAVTADKKFSDMLATMSSAAELKTEVPKPVQDVLKKLGIEAKTMADAVAALVAANRAAPMTKKQAEDVIQAILSMPAMIANAIKAIKA